MEELYLCLGKVMLSLFLIDLLCNLSCNKNIWVLSIVLGLTVCWDHSAFGRYLLVFCRRDVLFHWTVFSFSWLCYCDTGSLDELTMPSNLLPVFQQGCGTKERGKFYSTKYLNVEKRVIRNTGRGRWCVLGSCILAAAHHPKIVLSLLKYIYLILWDTQMSMQ